MEVVATQWQDVVSDPRYESSLKEIQVKILLLLFDDN